MQRPPYNQGFSGPGMPMQNQGMPGQPPANNYFGAPRPNQPAPGFGPPGGMAPQNPQQNCFMPAATIRKISNTTPPRFDPCFQ